MVYPALLPLMRTPRLPVVDWTDAHRRFKWTRPFRRKKKCGFCACAITFQLASTSSLQWPASPAAYRLAWCLSLAQDCGLHIDAGESARPISDILSTVPSRNSWGRVAANCQQMNVTFQFLKHSNELQIVDTNKPSGYSYNQRCRLYISNNLTRSEMDSSDADVSRPFFKKAKILTKWPLPGEEWCSSDIWQNGRYREKSGVAMTSDKMAVTGRRMV